MQYPHYTIPGLTVLGAFLENLSRASKYRKEGSVAVLLYVIQIHT